MWTSSTVQWVPLETEKQLHVNNGRVYFSRKIRKQLIMNGYENTRNRAARLLQVNRAQILIQSSPGDVDWVDLARILTLWIMCWRLVAYIAQHKWIPMQYSLSTFNRTSIQFTFLINSFVTHIAQQSNALICVDLMDCCPGVRFNWKIHDNFSRKIQV